MSKLTVLTASFDFREEMEARQLPGNFKQVLHDMKHRGCFG